MQQLAAVMNKVTSNTTIAFSNMVGPTEDISFYGHHLSYIAPGTCGQPQVRTYTQTTRIKLGTKFVTK